MYWNLIKTKTVYKARGCIQIYTQDGWWLQNIGNFGEKGGEFINVRGVCITTSGIIVVNAEDEDDDYDAKLIFFDPTGVEVRRFGSINFPIAGNVQFGLEDDFYVGSQTLRRQPVLLRFFTSGSAEQGPVFTVGS